MSSVLGEQLCRLFLGSDGWTSEQETAATERRFIVRSNKLVPRGGQFFATPFPQPFANARDIFDRAR